MQYGHFVSAASAPGAGTAAVTFCIEEEAFPSSLFCINTKGLSFKSPLKGSFLKAGKKPTSPLNLGLCGTPFCSVADLLLQTYHLALVLSVG